MPRTPLRGTRKIFQDRVSGEKAGNTTKSGLAFSWPLLGALAVFLIGAVVWAFFMGFMVGQGHNPNTKIQEITGISLSSDQAEQSELQPEAVQDETPAPSDKPLAEYSPTIENTKTELDFRKPKGAELAAWGEAPKTSSENSSKKDKPSKTQKEQLFDFSFQIAAFKSQVEAENLQKKLSAISVKTKIQKSGKVHLLVTNIRGPANTPENLRQKLLPLKLGKPLQLSRKELTSGAKRNK